MADAAPPGWYPDPAQPGGGRQRWWDGVGWTSHVADGEPPAPGDWTAPEVTESPLPPVPPGHQPGAVVPVGPFGTGPFRPTDPGGPYGGVPPAFVPYIAMGPTPRGDLESERSTAKLARTLLLVAAAIYVVQFVAVAFVYHSFWHDVLQVQQTNQGSTGSTSTPFSGQGTGFTLASGLLQLIGLALIGVQVVFLAWAYKAAKLARDLGLPARHSPGWAVAGFIVPIVNFWFPYQSVRDMFPPHHPDHPLVLRWWLLWLSVQFSGLAVGLASLVSVGVGLAVALVAILLVALAVQAARLVVERVEVVHTELVDGMTGLS
jgi:hypothetical protein